MFKLIILSLNDSCTFENNKKKNLAALLCYLYPCSYCISAEISTQCYLNFNDTPCQPVVTTERNPNLRWIVVTVPHSDLKIKCLHFGCFFRKNQKSNGKKAQDWFLSGKYKLLIVSSTVVSHKLFFIYLKLVYFYYGWIHKMSKKIVSQLRV